MNGNRYGSMFGKKPIELLMAHGLLLTWCGVSCNYWSDWRMNKVFPHVEGLKRLKNVQLLSKIVMLLKSPKLGQARTVPVPFCTLGM